MSFVDASDAKAVREERRRLEAQLVEFGSSIATLEREIERVEANWEDETLVDGDVARLHAQWLRDLDVACDLYQTVVQIHAELG